MGDIDGDRVWDVLVVECGANDSHAARLMFTTDWERHARLLADPRDALGRGAFEYRFVGALDMGGKLWWNPHWDDRSPLYVSCSLQDETPERLAMVDRANEQLADLVRAVRPPRKPFLKGEQPVRVDGYEGTWVVISKQDGDTVEVAQAEHGMLLVNAAKVHRGHYQWSDDD